LQLNVQLRLGLGHGCTLLKFVAQDFQKLVGIQTLQVVGLLEMVNPGWESMRQISGGELGLLREGRS